MTRDCPAPLGPLGHLVLEIGAGEGYSPVTDRQLTFPFRRFPDQSRTVKAESSSRNFYADLLVDIDADPPYTLAGINCETLTCAKRPEEKQIIVFRATDRS